MMRVLLLLVILAEAGGAWQLHPSSVLRQPLQKKQIKIESPKNYAPRLLRIDPATGEGIYYDPKPEVVMLDVRSGKHGLKWIGYDGKPKTIVYYRPDAFEATVSASVIRDSSGLYRYSYIIENSPSSGQSVEGFALQTLSADTRPGNATDLFIGVMSKNEEMSEGTWINFGAIGPKGKVEPGRQMQLRLVSPAPPGLVECKMHGILGMKGVGEEPPQELENVLPGYAAWPTGYTIGPVDRIKLFGLNKRARYLRKHLAQFQQLGWISPDRLSWYEKTLQEGSLKDILKQVAEDFSAGRVTSEVLGLIQSAVQ